MAFVSFLFIFSLLCKLGAECTWITLDLSLKQTDDKVLVQDSEHYGIPFKVFAPKSGFDVNTVVDADSPLWKAAKSNLKCTDVSLYFGGESVSLAILSIYNETEVYSKYYVKVDRLWVPVHPQQWITKMVRYSPAIARHIAARETPLESAVTKEEVASKEEETIIDKFSAFIGSTVDKVDETLDKVDETLDSFSAFIGSTVDKVDETLDKVDETLDKVDETLDSLFTPEKPVVTPKPSKAVEVKDKEPVVAPKPSFVGKLAGTTTKFDYESENVIYKSPKDGYLPQNYVGLNIAKPNYELFMVEYNVSEVLGKFITPLYGNALVAIYDGDNKIWAAKDGEEYCKAVRVYWKGDFSPIARFIIQKPDRVVILGYIKEDGIWKPVGDSQYHMLYHSMDIADFTGEDIEKIKTGELASSFSTAGIFACFAVALIAYYL